jgi:hypothetical protein
VTKGLPTRVQVWLDRTDSLEATTPLESDGATGAWINTKRYSRDDHAHVIASLDAKGHRTETRFDDALGVVPVEESVFVKTASGTGQSWKANTRAEYELSTGLLTRSWDFSRNRTTYDYDGPRSSAQSH